MKTKKLNKSLEIQNLPGSAFAHKTEKNMLKAHQNMILLGKRGSGKSFACCNYLKMSNFDRIFVISSTFESNKKLMNYLNIDEDDIYDPEDALRSLEDIIQKVNQERDDYLEYHEKLKKHKQLKKYLHNLDYFVNNIPVDLMEMYDDIVEPPTHKYNGKIPFLALWIDDCQSTPLYRTPKFLNFITRHRHIGAFPTGGALGISVFQCVQNLTSASGGLPRACRNNCTSMCIFRIKDEKEQKQIYESIAGEVSREEYEEAYEYATSEPYGFLLIDLHPKPGFSIFRKQFNEIIYF